MKLSQKDRTEAFLFKKALILRYTPLPPVYTALTAQNNLEMGAKWTLDKKQAFPTHFSVHARCKGQMAK